MRFSKTYFEKLGIKVEERKFRIPPELRRYKRGVFKVLPGRILTVKKHWGKRNDYLPKTNGGR